jgi:antitoxin PrlF
MNAQSKIDHETLVNMTSKGQVLIPKALRELNGLTPGGAVRVGTNDRGETVILPATGGASETSTERQTRIRAALAALCGKYPIGMSTDEYMREIRGDWQP